MARPSVVDPDREPAAPPPPRGWLRPGSGFLGLPWLLGLGAITVIPLLIYVVSYVPWIELGNQWFAGYPAGNSGQTLLDLQKSMYDYHNFLRATHAASSPWWAWPFDLKPVWFEQHGYAGGTTAVIYDTGNLVAFWLAIPAVLWTAYMAWKRRSLPLTFVTIAIASLWLPWARIDRATFQYHIFTTLPFSFMALAYFLAELWHGPSRRTWALRAWRCRSGRDRAAPAVAAAPTAVRHCPYAERQCRHRGVRCAVATARAHGRAVDRPVDRHRRPCRRRGPVLHALARLDQVERLAPAAPAGVLLRCPCLAWWWSWSAPASVAERYSKP